MRKSKSELFRPTVEALADRVVPTVAVVNGDIVITGRDIPVVSNAKVGLPTFAAADDVVTVNPVHTLVTIGHPPFVINRLVLTGYRVVDNGTATDIPVSQVTGTVVFNGLGGNDRFENKTGLRALADGGAGSDTLTGGAGNDTLHGGDGNDRLEGGAGNDYLDGDAGNDSVYGGTGNDTVGGGAGTDAVVGDAGDDYLTAGADALLNWLSGGAGNDTMTGGLGYDHMEGGDGNDFLFGLGGNDRMFGEAGNDFLDAGTGADDLDGGAGLDSARVAAGSQVLACESVQITNVPTDQPQTDSWSCGPNSVSRYLRAYGINASYGQVRSYVDDEAFLHNYLGTSTIALLKAMRHWKPDAVREEETNSDRVVDLLRAGKPVIVLVHDTELHYVVLTGYAAAADRFDYTDTDGGQKTWTRAQFEDKWSWVGHVNGVTEAAMWAAGVKNRTLFH